MKRLQTLLIKLLGGHEKGTLVVDEPFQKKLSRYIERTTKDIDLFTARHTLSAQEFDKQIVALSGGGLALTITLAKDMLAKAGVSGTWLLYLSWGSFILALTGNLWSHRVSLGHYNLMIERSTYYRACAEEEVEENLAQEDAWKKRIDSKTEWVGWLNSGAMWACLGGILFFVIFTVVNKYSTNGTPGNASTTASADNRNRPNQRAASHDSATQSRPSTPASGGQSDTTGQHFGKRQQAITDRKQPLQPAKHE